MRVVQYRTKLTEGVTSGSGFSLHIEKQFVNLSSNGYVVFGQMGVQVSAGYPLSGELSLFDGSSDFRCRMTKHDGEDYYCLFAVANYSAYWLLYTRSV